MFKKIDLNLSEHDLSVLKGQITYNYRGIFLEQEVNDYEQLDRILKSKIKFHIQPSRILFSDFTSDATRPHIDGWPTAMNYYFSDISGTTYFYDQIQKIGAYGSEIWKLHNPENLKIVSSFTARKNDCYLLNTHQAHSVDIPSGCGIRSMLRFVWKNHDFLTVSDSIEVLP